MINYKCILNHQNSSTPTYATAIDFSYSERRKNKNKKTFEIYKENRRVNMDFAPIGFGRFLLIHELERSEHSTLYLARLADESEGFRPLILKKLNSSSLQNLDLVEFFVQEIKTTASLSHPNILHTYDYGFGEKEPYVVLEYIEGKTLQEVNQRLKELENVLGVSTACFWAIQCCDAINYAHGFHKPITKDPACVVHGKISPENVLIDFSGHLRILNFGVALEITKSYAPGTPIYLSPEQAESLAPTEQSDIFSLALVLWELLAGAPAIKFDKGTEIGTIFQSFTPLPPSSKNPDLPARLDEIILKALQIKPTDRTNKIEELQNSLIDFLASYDPSYNHHLFSSHFSDLFAEGAFADSTLETDKSASMPQVQEPPCGTSFPVAEVDLAEACVVETPKRENALQPNSLSAVAPIDGPSPDGQQSINKFNAATFEPNQSPAKPLLADAPPNPVPVVESPSIENLAKKISDPSQLMANLEQNTEAVAATLIRETPIQKPKAVPVSIQAEVQRAQQEFAKQEEQATPEIDESLLAPDPVHEAPLPVLPPSPSLAPSKPNSVRETTNTRIPQTSISAAIKPNPYEFEEREDPQMPPQRSSLERQAYLQKLSSASPRVEDIITQPARQPFPFLWVAVAGLAIGLLFFGGNFRKIILQNSNLNRIITLTKKAKEVATPERTLATSESATGKMEMAIPTPEVPPLPPPKTELSAQGDARSYFVGFDCDPSAEFDVFINGIPVIRNSDGHYPAPRGKHLAIEVMRKGYEDFRFIGELSGENPSIRFKLVFIPERAKGKISFEGDNTTLVRLSLEGILVYETMGRIDDLSFAIGKYTASIKKRKVDKPQKIEFELKEGDFFDLN